MLVFRIQLLRKNQTKGEFIKHLFKIKEKPSEVPPRFLTDEQHLFVKKN